MLRTGRFTRRYDSSQKGEGGWREIRKERKGGRDVMSVVCRHSMTAVGGRGTHRARDDVWTADAVQQGFSMDAILHNLFIRPPLSRDEGGARARERSTTE